MSQLMIPNSNFDDSGSYKCEATSEYFENPVSATEGDFFSLYTLLSILHIINSSSENNKLLENICSGFKTS